MGIAQRISARLPRELRIRPTTEIWETEHRLLHALGRARPPEAVQWMVTRSCDLHCAHCYAKAGHKAKGELTTDEAKRLVIDATADMGCPLLVLAGGELWLRRDIETLIEHAVARGLEWAMHTHGGHVPKHRELLRRHPPALAAISLDGDREFHDRFRGKAGSHDAALAAVEVLREVGCREVVLGTTVTRHNADHLVDLFPTVVRSGAHSWGLHLVAPEGRADLELVPRPEQLRRLAAFARSRRALFPVELCNEWGSAGTDDVHYRDRPFLCGAGRISLVIDPTGEVMPCTTTDPSESEGNVRNTPLRTIWRDGFTRFRRGDDPTCSDGSECWLQSRHGVRIAEAAFGPVARPRPKLVDFVPSRLVSLGHRTLAPRQTDDGFASPMTRKMITAAAVGLAFLGACTLPREPDEPTPHEPSGRVDEPADAKTDAALQSPPKIDVVHEWPASLDASGLQFHAIWADMAGPWKTVLLPGLLAWERSGSAVDVQLSAGVSEFDREWSRYLARGFGKSTLIDLLALLDAAERASLFDAAFAAHLWRAAERVPAPAPADTLALEHRATLYGRLAHHHHVARALVATAGTLGPITQRAWLKKSAPPPGWRSTHVPDGFESAAKTQFETDTGGPWDTVGISVRFTSEGPSPIQYREGIATELSSKQTHRWARLDVISFPSATRVQIGHTITIEIPAQSLLTHASLAAAMSEAVATRLDALITRALDGDDAAVTELEALLPIAQARLRTHLDAKPDAKGAPVLRTILVAYEE
jgi:MoaA/NifB/PqqE/SkfB family radical SAM enzyme